MDKKTVLVVDDAPENIDLLVGLLKEQFIVKAARDGKIALKIAHSPSPPDLILLDIIMPEMDGFDVCRELKSDPATSQIPVIFLSGEIGDEERRRGRELGAADYLTKPVEPAKLNATIQAAISVTKG